MKRKSILIKMILLLSTSLAVAFSINYFKGQDEFKKLGEGKSEAIKEYYEEVKSINKGTKSLRDVDYIIEIQDNKISKKEFMVRYISRVNGLTKYTNPKEDTVNSFKQDIWDRKFATEYGILPTQEEIEEYTLDVKKEYESTEEGKALIKSYTEGLGMTEDEYWEYNKLCEAPYVVTHSKVEKYLEENGIPLPDLELIEFTILDKEYFESL